MVVVTPLHVLNVDGYTRLVTSSLRHLLPQVAPTGPVFAWGCSDGAEPVGVLAAREFDGDLEVAWLYVVQSSRRRGVAGALLGALEGKAVELGARQLRLMHSIQPSVAEPVRGLLAKHGWTVESEGFVVCALRAASLGRASWVKRWRKGSSFDIVGWADLSARERHSLACALEAEPTQETLSPFRHEGGMDPRTSLALRTRNEVAGWLITHAAQPNNLAYSLLGVRRHLRGTGNAFALVAETLRRQLDVYGEDSLVLLTASKENASMMKLIRGSFAPHVEWAHETAASVKIIATASGA